MESFIMRAIEHIVDAMSKKFKEPKNLLTLSLRTNSIWSFIISILHQFSIDKFFLGLWTIEKQQKDPSDKIPMYYELSLLREKHFLGILKQCMHTWNYIEDGEECLLYQKVEVVSFNYQHNCFKQVFIFDNLRTTIFDSV